MVLNKKGMFFTLIAIAILTLFLITYTFYTKFPNRSATRERITNLNTFIFSTEKDLERQMYIAGFRAMFVMQTEALEQGNYISSPENTFNEIIFNGTFNGVSQPVMLGATFADIQNSIQQKAGKVNANIQLINPTISISQTDPWNVEITLTTNLHAQDQGGLVSWNKTQNIISKISIENFEDPLYLLNTGSLVTNKIIKTPFTSFVSGTNVSNLNNHTSNSYYISSITAPNYLKRLQGLTIADTNGIESLVNIPELSNQGIITQDKSVVDYIYFSENSPISCKITGMPSWFKIDQAHLTQYQANGLEYNCV